MVLATQKTFLIPRIQAMNVGGVMVLLNELTEAAGKIFADNILTNYANKETSNF